MREEKEERVVEEKKMGLESNFLEKNPPLLQSSRELQRDGDEDKEAERGVSA